MLNPRPIFCLDLDDTIFQTRRKISPEQQADCVPAALDREGNPRSFMTTSQHLLVQWLNSCALLVPVTGRGTAETRRVCIPFSSWQVLTHGAVILRPDGSIYRPWQEQIMAAVTPLQDSLQNMQTRCTEFFQAQGINAFARINREYETGIYLVMKHRDSSRIDELYRVTEELLPRLDTSPYRIVCNGNNIALLPHGIEKAHALRVVLDELFQEHGTLPVIGLGDSLSDLPFLSICDWWGMPRTSQIATSLFTKETGVPEC